MSEEKLNSNKLDFETKRQSLNNNQEDNRESYKPISEESGFNHVTGETVKNSNMVREKSAEQLQDGADEKMLGSDDKETLALKNIEVKFIASDQNQNGDAKIEIENGGGKTFTGMTKEELMKYANDPFWIKLRWFLFILFWLAWIGMLVGAIAIIVFAPKCAAPTPLAWFKKGPLAKINGAVDEDTIEKMKEFNIQGVVYELPDHETYKVESGEVHERIKGIVEKFNAKDIHVVIDLTPNFVTKDDQLFVDATKEAPDHNSLSAFITNDALLNWKQVDGEEAAWKKAVKNTHFLSQFGDFYDVRLDVPIVQEKLEKVIENLANVGVKGFRFVNAKHLIVSNSKLEDEKPRSTNEARGYNINQYQFYAHPQREFVDGLERLLATYNSYVMNVTKGEGFFTIRDDISDHSENFAVSNSSKRIDAFELPRFGFINSYLRSSNKDGAAKGIFEGFNTLSRNVDLSSVWTQIQFAKSTYEDFEESAYKLFVSFLRGVQIASLKDLVYNSNDNGTNFKKIQAERESRAAVYEHGNFNYYLSNDNSSAFAYSRIKAGNPGLFVVLNPSSVAVKANFTNSFAGSDLSMILASENFGSNWTKTKLSSDNIEMPKQSAAVFTFVPK